jgi:hypothetical protein
VFSIGRGTHHDFLRDMQLDLWHLKEDLRDKQVSLQMLY